LLNKLVKSIFNME